MKTLCLAITGFFLYSHSIFALAADPADLLFQAFSAKCESQGSFTARALNETNALEGVLSAVLTDPECKGLLPVLNSVTNLSQQLSFLDQGFGDDQKKDLEAYAEKVSIYLSTVSDPTQQSLLVGELANTQVEILKYDQTKQELKRQAQNRAIQSLGNYVESLAQIYPSQALCFERNNTLPLQLGSQLLSLSGGFFGPVINAATTLGGRLFSALFDYFRDKKFVDAIKKFRGAKLQAGLSCAMEALEQTVCDIDDQKALLKVHEKYRTQPEVPVEWKGYDLLERQYSVVQSFLRQIEAGSDPASDLQGSSRANIRTMEGNYRSTIERTLGLMGETARQIELLTQRNSGHDAIQQVSRNLLDSLAGVILYQNGPNVYTSVIPSSENYTRLLLWLRFGDPSPTLPVVPGTKDPSPYGTYYSTIQNNDVDLNKVRANVAAIHAAAQVQLGIQKTLVLNPDPQGVIADWSVRDKNTASAGEIMRRFVSYLKGLEKNWIDHPEWFADSYGQRDQVAVVQQTRDRFEKTLGILESKIPDKEKLIGIFSVMDLQEQDQVITGRLNEIVQMDLEKRLRLGLLSDAKNLETTIRLATEDLFTSLYPNSVNFLTKIKEDLGEAEVIAKSNLKNFYDFFKDPILRAMEDLAKDSKTWGENESGAFQKKISKLCILILNAPQLDDGDFSNLVNVCRKAEMKETFENSVVSVSFDQLYSHYSGEPEKRMCAYRRFRNQVDLKEILEQRPIKYNSSK